MHKVHRFLLLLAITQAGFLKGYGQQQVLAEAGRAVSADEFTKVDPEGHKDSTQGLNGAIAEIATRAKAHRSSLALSLKEHGTYRLSCATSAGKAPAITLKPGVSIEGNGATFHVAGQRVCIGMYAGSQLSINTGQPYQIANIANDVSSGDKAFRVDNVPSGCAPGIAALQKFVTVLDDQQESRYWAFSKVESCDPNGRMITTDTAAPVTVRRNDMCANYGPSRRLSTCSLWIFPETSKMQGLSQDIYLRNFTLEGDSSTTDSTRMPSGLYLTRAKHVAFNNLTFRNVYSGLYAQYVDGLASDKLTVDGALAPSSNNKAIDLAECVNCVFRQTEISRFAGYGIYAEAYSKARFEGLTINDTAVPGKNCRNSKAIVVHTGADLYLSNVIAKGNSACNFAEVLADPNERNILVIHNLVIENPNINIESGVFSRITGILDVRAGVGFTGVFKDFVTKTLTFHIASNRSNQVFELPEGVYRDVGIVTSSTTGLERLYFQNSSGAGFSTQVTLKDTKEESCADAELVAVCGFGSGGGNTNKFNSLGLAGRKLSVSTDDSYPAVGGQLILRVVYATPD